MQSVVTFIGLLQDGAICVQYSHGYCMVIVTAIRA